MKDLNISQKFLVVKVGIVHDLHSTTRAADRHLSQKESPHPPHDQLHDRKSLLSDSQRDLLVRDLKRYQELLYQCRLNRQIDLR